MRFPCPIPVSIALALLLAAPASAADADSTELVQILRARGVLDDAEYARLMEKADQEDGKNWYDRIAIWGDLRTRYESFYFYEDPVDGQTGLPDRHRVRIRLRLNFKGDVNDHSDVFIRLTTGQDSRTTNETLGANVDFGTDSIFLDKAYVRLSPFAHGRLPEREGSAWFYFGRTQQPWRSKSYKDLLLWDDEISPAGFYGEGDIELAGGSLAYGSGGVFILDENSTAKDPAMAHVQLGFDAELGDRFEVGARGTWFHFWDLDAPFIARGVDSSGLSPTATFAAGNLPGGLTGNPLGGHANVFEFGAHLEAKLFEQWPMMIWGNFSKNIDASSTVVTNAATSALPGTFSASKQDLAWLVGLQLGDPKQILQLRMVYAWIEANAFPGQLLDSDLFDQFTNRKGFMWALSRRVMENTTASATIFLSDPIETGGAYLASLAGSERVRVQMNLVFGF